MLEKKWCSPQADNTLVVVRDTVRVNHRGPIDSQVAADHCAKRGANVLHNSHLGKKMGI